MKIKYDLVLMRCMSFFESLTHAKLKDCFVSGEQLVFVVQEGQAGKAIGKNGANVRRLEYSLKKKIRIIEFDTDMVKFISNLIYPLSAKEVRTEGGIVTIEGFDTKTKGLLIGRSSQNLKKTEAILKRYFDIEQVKVI